MILKTKPLLIAVVFSNAFSSSTYAFTQNVAAGTYRNGRNH